MKKELQKQFIETLKRIHQNHVLIQKRIQELVLENYRLKQRLKEKK